MKDLAATRTLKPLALPPEAKERLRILFIAKNALWTGGMDHEDGNHALYHVEMREVLQGLGLNLQLADGFEVLFTRPEVDFVFPLLNRAGFCNSEMLAPLLCTRLGLPFLGAAPIIRGLGDDKHLAKRAAVAAGVPTAEWAIYRRGAPVEEADCPRADRLVVKPNASSASWGVRDAADWKGVREGVEAIHAEGHDAIVEPFLLGSDVEVPVIATGAPEVLPLIIFRQSDPAHLRTYQEKRGLVDRAGSYRLERFEDEAMSAKILRYSQALWKEYLPFDYGRFEFRVNEETGEINFLEVNLNCNLWSQKTIGRAAAMAGFSQPQLIETILTGSLRRHGLID